MKAFILGGGNQTYLAYQVDAIREFVLDCEDIIYVTGPIHPNPLLAASAGHVEPVVRLTMLRLPDEEVRPQLKFRRIQTIVNVICDKYLGEADYGLFLHGDLIPVATLNEEILLDKHLSAGCRGHSIQWRLTRNGIGYQVMEKRNVKIWPIGLVKLDGIDMQVFQPGFIHADNLATDDDETIQKKLAAMKRAYPARANDAVSSSS